MWGGNGRQIFYANCVTYPEIARPNTQAIHPGFVVTHVLSQCKNNDEIVELFQHKITVTKQTVTGLVPYLHWVFTDKTGETIVIEPDQDDHVTIHRNTTGILTNAPGYQRQKNNLNKRFANLTRFPIANVPGEFSSRTRFIRANLLKEYALRGGNEAEGVAYLFRLLQNLAMPLGMVPVSQGYEYSIYTAVMFSESLNYYWHSYRNLQTYCINLHDLIHETKIKLWPLNNEQPKYVDLTNQGETL